MRTYDKMELNLPQNQNHRKIQVSPGCHPIFAVLAQGILVKVQDCLAKRAYQLLPVSFFDLKVLDLLISDTFVGEHAIYFFLKVCCAFFCIFARVLIEL